MYCANVYFAKGRLEFSGNLHIYTFQYAPHFDTSIFQKWPYFVKRTLFAVIRKGYNALFCASGGICHIT